MPILTRPRWSGTWSTARRSCAGPGGALSAEEAARRLGIAREVVAQRRHVDSLLAIREDCGWRYPTCQFEHGDVVPGLVEVVRSLTAEGPWVTLEFLLAPDTVLEGRRPRRPCRLEIVRGAAPAPRIPR